MDTIVKEHLVGKIEEIRIKNQEIPNTTIGNTNIRKELDEILYELLEDIEKGEIPNTFYQRILNLLQTISSFMDNYHYEITHFTYNENNIDNTILQQMGRFVTNLEYAITSCKTTYHFFKELHFFNENLVVVGANGSGKSTLISNLKQTISEKIGIVIPAQKLFIIPTFDSIPNYNSTLREYENYQLNYNNGKTTYSASQTDSIPYDETKRYGAEYKYVLKTLLAERQHIRNKYCDSVERGKEVNIDDLSTKINKVIEIWNYLIEHRELFCDGSNIKVRVKESQEEYPAHQMSDGEKNILYLIGRVLLASENAMIIIDEPEMYLHKAIINKLWDKLEKERKDCIFVYLTHDLDFASSRNAKKHWIKNFTYPNSWEFEEIKENEISENLLMKLLGSRKKILFCEGKKKSLDTQIYEILFPDYTVTPVESCSKVIQYTRAFNRYPSKEAQAFGIIDRDFRTDKQIQKLQTEQVYLYDVAEIENLFLIEDFLQEFATCKDEKIDISKIKEEILIKMENDKENQISNYVSSYINYIFSEEHLKNGRTLQEVKDHFTNFQNNIKIEDVYNTRKQEYEKILNDKDYSKAILIYNNKGLHNIVEKTLKYSNNSYRDKALEFLKKNDKTQNILRSVFPEFIQQQESLMKDVSNICSVDNAEGGYC
ncbi:DUF4435 domain-containing protein [Capnocytophaga canimorsus]|uniref:DUF4435 domain-containing protein n=1 Tax=Capnocytophaga canimorsus TaxID=28188 RepID=UPI0037D3BC4C